MTDSKKIEQFKKAILQKLNEVKTKDKEEIEFKEKIIRVIKNISAQQ